MEQGSIPSPPPQQWEKWGREPHPNFVYESIFFHYWVNRVKIEMIEYKKSWKLMTKEIVHFPNVILLMNLLYEYLDKLNGGLGEKNLGEAKD